MGVRMKKVYAYSKEKKRYLLSGVREYLSANMSFHLVSSFQTKNFQQLSSTSMKEVKTSRLSTQ